MLDPEAEQSALSIFSVSGRLLRRYDAPAHPAGPGRIVWDGRDDGGQPVSPGVYFVRLESASLSTTRRVVVIR